MIDAHHHFWDPRRRDYPWMGEELFAIRRPFGPDELRPLLAANGVEKTVLVQTVSQLEETEEFLRVAEITDFVAAVVGWVDLKDPEVSGRIASLHQGPGGIFLKGIRHQVQDEPDPTWLLQDEVQRGIAAVGEAGLVYELLVRPVQLPAAIETVHRHPGVQFVLDHAAKPRIRAGSRDPEWEAAMAPLSNLPNVACKLSGLVTEAEWERWNAAQLEPYVTRVLEWFGPERCMFGSDWPVCLLAASYAQVVATMSALAGDSEQILSRTAMRVYGLT